MVDLFGVGWSDAFWERCRVQTGSKIGECGSERSERAKRVEVPSKDEAKTKHRLNKDKANAKQRRSKDEAKTKNSEAKTKHTRSKDEANAKQRRSKDEAKAFKLPLVRASPSFVKQMCVLVRLLSRFKAAGVAGVIADLRPRGWQG